MYDETTAATRKDLARQYTENAELWLRKLIHHQLSKLSGPEYITKGKLKNKELILSVQRQKDKNPSKFAREIDATTFGQAIDILCAPKYWNSEFKEALRLVYPFGADAARFFLSKLGSVRNDVAHGRNCSSRQLEQVICYSNDLVEAIKAFFKDANMQRAYNVPMIVNYVDNLGNESQLLDVSEDINGRIIDWRRVGKGDLHTGDILRAEIEVDPSFSDDEYDVYWFIALAGYSRQSGETASLQIRNEHVGEQVELRFEVISKKDWHRHYGLDDSLCLIFRVLPPV